MRGRESYHTTGRREEDPGGENPADRGRSGQRFSSGTLRVRTSGDLQAASPSGNERTRSGGKPLSRSAALPLRRSAAPAPSHSDAQPLRRPAAPYTRTQKGRALWRAPHLTRLRARHAGVGTVSSSSRNPPISRLRSTKWISSIQWRALPLSSGSRRDCLFPERTEKRLESGER